MMQTNEKIKRHNDMVARLAESLRNNGYYVTADIDGYLTPYKIDGCVPDIIAKKGIETAIIEVEVRETSNSPHAKKQKEVFERYVENLPDTIFKQVIVD